MDSTSELRKELKKIGFTFKIKTFSEFKSFIYFNLNKEKYPSVFFSQDDVLKWQKLTIFLHENKEAIIKIKKI